MLIFYECIKVYSLDLTPISCSPLPHAYWAFCLARFAIIFLLIYLPSLIFIVSLFLAAKLSTESPLEQLHSPVGSVDIAALGHRTPAPTASTNLRMPLVVPHPRPMRHRLAQPPTPRLCTSPINTNNSNVPASRGWLNLLGIEASEAFDPQARKSPENMHFEPFEESHDLADAWPIQPRPTSPSLVVPMIRSSANTANSISACTLHPLPRITASHGAGRRRESVKSTLHRIGNSLDCESTATRTVSPDGLNLSSSASMATRTSSALLLPASTSRSLQFDTLLSPEAGGSSPQLASIGMGKRTSSMNMPIMVGPLGL
ncbi:unnamed protein product [Protopolystoma xenopodis]|uniref:Uncharacterized protein n=1 Tax=Protopolystoma xenopodis TaxID=117903 RepID=A0A448XLI2_9PLAT|nr:unnamed protein product [Protopolystoma xenopodis]